LNGLPPLGNNPLDADMLDDAAQPSAGSPLLAGGALIDDEGAAIVSKSTLPEDEAASEPAAAEAKEKGPGFLAKLAQSNPYTVMLFASAVALLIGILCLLLEWSSYSFEVKPTQTGQLPTATATTTVQVLAT
jgi:hypothetical protein